MSNIKHIKNTNIRLILLILLLAVPLVILAQVPPQTAMIFFKFHSQYNPTHYGIPNWGEPGNPGNFPLRNNWCTVACLDMIFSFYDGLGGPPPHPAGPPWPQQQIKAVANTDGATGGPWGGTYEDDARRASHFSVLSAGLNGGANGYNWRGLGYSAIDDNWKTQGWTLNQLKKLIATGYPLIVHVFPDSMMKYHESCPFMPAPGSESPSEPDSDYTNHGDSIQQTVLGHSVVLIGYNDSPVVWNNINPGWIAYYCPTVGARQSPQNFFWNTFWGGDFLFAAPWKLFTTCPQSVCTNSKFVIGMNAWYSAPWKIAVPNQNNVYPVDTSIATISVPAGFSLPNNDPVKDIYQWIKDAGDYTPPQIIILWIPGIPPSAGHFIIIVLPRILWTVKAPGAAGAANIKVDAKGVLHKCTSTSYPGPAGYKDTIGGRTTLAVNVVPLIAANPGFDLHGPTYWQSSTGNGIWYSPSPPEAGQTTNIYAEVHNYGTSPTSGGTVNFYRGNPTLTQSAGSTNWTSLGSLPLPTINPGDSATVGPLPVTFPPTNTYGESYFTIFAKINYTDDPGTTGWFLEDDNVTCENYRTAQGTIGVPETLTFLVENPESRSYYFAVGIDKSQLPSGWTAQLSAPLDSDPPLIPSGGTLPVKLIVTPSSAGIGKVDMMGYLIDTTGTIKRITGGLTFQIDVTVSTIPNVLWPNGGEGLSGRTAYTISWTSVHNSSARYRILFSHNSGVSYLDTIARNVPATESTYLWLTPSINDSCCRVKVQWINTSGNVESEDESDADFTITTSPIMTLPNGNEIWAGGSNKVIKWLTAGIGVTRYRLLLSTDHGSTYLDTIASNIASTETTYNWLIPALNFNSCRLLVQALDSTGSVLTQDASDADFTIDSDSPSIPLLASPSNNYFSNNTTVLFVWYHSQDNLSGVGSYLFQCARNIAFNNPIDTIISDTFASLTLTDTTYYWRVRSYDNAGNMSNWSAVWSFEIDIGIPNTPGLISPINGIWLTNVNVIFNWSQVTLNDSKIERFKDSKIMESANLQTDAFASPVRYILQADTSRNFTNPIIDTTGLLFDTLVLNQARYFWRVRAYDLAGNQGAFSGRDSFGIDHTAPSIPNLVSPINGAMINNPNITFVWNRSSDNLSGVSRYTLQGAIDPGFLVSLDTIVTDTTITITLIDTTYYWRVKSYDRAGNQSSWSSTRSFELDTRIPNAPVLASPLNGIWLTNTSVVFNWSQVTLNDSKIGKLKDAKILESANLESANLQIDVFASAIRYILQVDTSRSFTNPIIDTTSLVYDTLVLNQARYFWRVKAYDLAGNQGIYSGRDSFGFDITPPSIPTLVSPLNNAVLTDSFVRFVWRRSTDNVSGVRDYRLQVAVDSNFTSPIDTVTQDSTITLLLRNIRYWRVKAIDRANNQSNWSERRMLTVTGIEETNNPTITCFFIQNSPNPFLRFTDIRYGVPLNTNVKIAIYNSTGTEIATLINRIHNPGLYSIRWNTKENKGKICPNGIYFYRLVTDEYQATRKMLMLK